MRSKEVEKAIDRGNAFVEENLYRIGGIKGFSIKGGKEEDFETEQLKTILSYIEQLEQLPNKIRDKIKELEEEIERLEKNQNEIIALGGDDLHIREGIWQIEEQIKLLKSIIEGEK